VRVVEAGSYITAPFAAMMLAELGASVMKVEPPTGDAFRRFGKGHDGLSASWINVNHGKDVVTINLKSADGAAKMRRLLDDADVFVHNWRPGVAASLGLDAATLRAADPRLIHVSVSGYGQTGPNAKAPVFDTLLQAASGLTMAESYDGRPAPLRSFIVDKTTALYVTQAVLATLYERERTGVGATLELSMLDAAAHFNFPDLFVDRTFLADGDEPVAVRNPVLVLETSDGHICLAPVRGHHLSGAVEAVGHPEWATDLKAAGGQRAIVQLLLARLEPETRKRSTTEWVDAFAAAGVPAAAVLTQDEHLVDEQVAHNRLYAEATSPVGPVRQVRHPLVRDGAPLPAASTPLSA
jgi:formyl-CoA transferase